MRSVRGSWLVRVLATPRMSQALTESIVIVALLTASLRSLLGTPGMIAIVSGLLVLAALSLVGQPERVEWRGVLPLSLLTFFGVVVVSVTWSDYPLATLTGITNTLAFAALGLYIALVRDMIQLARGIGNVVRWILGLSLGLEILSGLLLPTPLDVFENQARLAEGGPIQGVVGSATGLAFIALLGLINFGIEWRTRMVSREVSTVSIVIALATLVLTQSGAALVTLGVLAAAAGLLILLRRLGPTARVTVQLSLLALVGAVIAVITATGTSLDRVFGSSAEVDQRVLVWDRVGLFAQQQPVFGWGWVGIWPTTDVPYPMNLLDGLTTRPQPSALSSYLDVQLQLGVVGLVVLLLTLTLAIGRAWLVASTRVTTAYLWPALTLLLLASTGVTESVLLAEEGVLLFVTAAFAAARHRSWRGHNP